MRGRVSLRGCLGVLLRVKVRVAGGGANRRREVGRTGHVVRQGSAPGRQRVVAGAVLPGEGYGSWRRVRPDPGSRCRVPRVGRLVPTTCGWMRGQSKVVEDVGVTQSARIRLETGTAFRPRWPRSWPAT